MSFIILEALLLSGIQVPDSVKIGEKFDCVVKLFSQMPIDLSDCEWMVESVGLIQAIKSPQTYVCSFRNLITVVTIVKMSFNGWLKSLCKKKSLKLHVA